MRLNKWEALYVYGVINGLIPSCNGLLSVIRYLVQFQFFPAQAFSRETRIARDRIENLWC